MNLNRFFKIVTVIFLFMYAVFFGNAAALDFPVADSASLPGFYDPYNTELLGNTRNFFAISGGIRNYDFEGTMGKENFHISYGAAAVSLYGVTFSVSYPQFGDRITRGGLFMDDGFLLTAGFRLRHLNARIGASLTVPFGFDTKSEGVSLNTGFATMINDYLMPFISFKNIISNGYTPVMDDVSFFTSTGWPFTADAGVMATPFDNFGFSVKGTALLSQNQLIPMGIFAMPLELRPGLSIDFFWRCLEWLEINFGISGSEKATKIDFSEFKVRYSSRTEYRFGMAFLLGDLSIRFSVNGDNRPVSGIPMISVTSGQFF